MNKILVFTVILIIFYSSNLYARSVYTMENTKLIKGIRYDLNNKPINGIVSVYYPTGELLLEMPYVNGKQNGVARGYRPDGSLLQEMRFKDSKEVSRDFYPLGKQFRI